MSDAWPMVAPPTKPCRLMRVRNSNNGSVCLNNKRTTLLAAAAGIAVTAYQEHEAKVQKGGRGGAKPRVAEAAILVRTAIFGNSATRVILNNPIPGIALTREAM